MDDNQFDFTKMQRRPLRMVMVKHAIEDPVFVHCVSDKLSMTPEVTITSHRNAVGEPVWYLGGEIAEHGARQTEGELIETARNKLTILFPWCDFSKARWGTFAIDRAEQKQSDGARPDGIGIAESHNLMLCWPTKLTLAPNLANTVLNKLQAANNVAGTSAEPAPPDFLQRPELATTPWEQF